MTSLCLRNNCCNTGDLQLPDRSAMPYPPSPQDHEAGAETLLDSRNNGKWFASMSRDESRPGPGSPQKESRRNSLTNLLSVPQEPKGLGSRRNSLTNLLPISSEEGLAGKGKTPSALESFSGASIPRKDSLPGIPLPKSASTASTAASGIFNGCWADGAHVHTVQGTKIYWSDGTTTEIEDTSPGGFSTTLWGTAYHALLDKASQVIHWNDGSDWLRLDASESSLDGFWRLETEAKSQRHSIRGRTLYWSDGSKSELKEATPGLFKLVSGAKEESSPGLFAMIRGTSQEKAIYCRLELGGQRLRWSDGDSWVRVVLRGDRISVRRVRFVLLCVALAVVFNVFYMLGVSLTLHRDWAAYPAEPEHPSQSWPEAQVWQFAAGWACMPLLLVHGIWATFLALNVQRNESQSMELEANRGKPAMLWLLEPMRLIALLHIIFYHEDPADPVGRWGFTWITFFMVLAGFVGSYQLLMNDPDVSKTTVLVHVWKRVKRLWPMYLLYCFVVSMPDYVEGSLWNGSIIPSWSGTVAAVRTLWSWMGLLYFLGLQTLIPLDPHFNFVARTCWFVPTLLLCEAALPLWLRGIHALLEQAAKRVAERDNLLGKVEPSRLLRPALILCSLAGLVTAANCACIAEGKVFLRMRALPNTDMSDAIFWFMRFTPLGHWSQVLLGAVLAKTFIMMQASDPESDAEIGEDGCCPEEVMPLSLSPPTRTMALLKGRSVEEADFGKGEDSPMMARIQQVLRCWPWFLGAACSGCLACLAVHIGTDEESGSTVLFMNNGGPAISFAALIVCLAQASLELEPHWLVMKIVQAVGAVCFPAYLFVSMSQQFVWHYCLLVFSPEYSVTVSSWLRIPFLILVQQLWDLASSKVRALCK